MSNNDPAEGRLSPSGSVPHHAFGRRICAWCKADMGGYVVDIIGKIYSPPYSEQYHIVTVWYGVKW